MLVKVNVVMAPGINADHIPAVAKKAKELGAYIVNILPLIPVPGTKFEGLRAPTAKERKALQDMCEVDIRQMRHCRQCRADAIGLLGEDRSAEFSHFTCAAKAKGETGMATEMEGDTRYRIAVASTDGREVDEHFGHAESFRTFLIDGENITEGMPIDVSEQGDVPLFGPGHRAKIESTADLLRGMDAVIATQYGDMAIEVLRQKGIVPVEDKGEVREALRRAVSSVFKERAAVFE
jgi:nitrogen fixation protein NifB